MAIGTVLALAKDGVHRFSKLPADKLRIIAGMSVEGDAHQGNTVKHRSRVAVNPGQPNLRQVHLIHAELFEELAAKGFAVLPGDLGENITTAGLDLLMLPRGTKLRIGAEVELEVTGLRNPCSQIDAFQAGLLAHLAQKAADGTIIRKAGIMAIVLSAGIIRTGDKIEVALPPPPHALLKPV